MTAERWLWSSLVFVGMVGVLAAQTAKPTFEVASVKRNMSGEPSSNANSAVLTPMPGGGFRAQNSTLQSIIQYVYSIPLDRLSGGPNWVRADRFDIIAKAERELPRDQVFLMVQSLLEDRFKLVLTKESRDADGYALTLARNDGRLGSDLQPQSESECKARRDAASAAGTIPLPPKSPAGTRPTAFGVCATISSFRAMLSQSLKTSVEDRTGLTGLWNYSLTYTNQPAASTTPLSPASDAPSLFTAVQEQLGLKLERQRGSIDIFTIQSVQQPTEN